MHVYRYNLVQEGGTGRGRERGQKIAGNPAEWQIRHILPTGANPAIVPNLPNAFLHYYYKRSIILPSSISLILTNLPYNLHPIPSSISPSSSACNKLLAILGV